MGMALDEVGDVLEISTEEGEGLSINAGALAMNISGSGPSVFAVANHFEPARKAETLMKKHFESMDIDYETVVVKASNKGTRAVF